MIYRLRNILWKLHKPQIKIFNFKILILKKQYLVMRIWLQNVFGVIKMIKSLPKTFLRTYYEVFFITHKFYWKLSKTAFPHIYLIDPKSPWDEFLWSERFFHQKVWVLKNILNTHHIVISSIEQKLHHHFNKIIPH